MSSAEWEDDDPFEEQRDKIENPMKRLFLAYGRDYLPQVSVGIFASVFARLLDLLPPLMLGIAIDAVFYEDALFSEQIPLVILPTRGSRRDRPNSSGSLSPSSGPRSVSGPASTGSGTGGSTPSRRTSSTTFGPTPTTRCSGSTWSSSPTSRRGR